eukprot:5345493-Amphidinium_carterae.1
MCSSLSAKAIDMCVARSTRSFKKLFGRVENESRTLKIQTRLGKKLVRVLQSFSVYHRSNEKRCGLVEGTAAFVILSSEDFTH